MDPSQENTRELPEEPTTKNAWYKQRREATFELLTSALSKDGNLRETAEKLGEMAGVKPQSISQVRLGYANLSSEVLDRLKAKIEEIITDPNTNSSTAEKLQSIDLSLLQKATDEPEFKESKRDELSDLAAPTPEVLPPELNSLGNGAQPGSVPVVVRAGGRVFTVMMDEERDALTVQVLPQGSLSVVIGPAAKKAIEG